MECQLINDEAELRGPLGGREEARYCFRRRVSYEVVFGFIGERALEPIIRSFACRLFWHSRVATIGRAKRSRATASARAPGVSSRQMIASLSGKSARYYLLARSDPQRPACHTVASNDLFAFGTGHGGDFRIRVRTLARWPPVGPLLAQVARCRRT